MAVAQITAQDFEAEVLSSPVPVVVYFFTPHCGPCRLLAPVYERFSDKHSGIKFVKLDASDAADLGTTHSIWGVPTVIAFQAGKEKSRFVGFSGEPALTKLVESFETP